MLDKPKMIFRALNWNYFTSGGPYPLIGSGKARLKRYYFRSSRHIFRRGSCGLSNAWRPGRIGRQARRSSRTQGDSAAKLRRKKEARLRQGPGPRFLKYRVDSFFTRMHAPSMQPERSLSSVIFVALSEVSRVLWAAATGRGMWFQNAKRLTLLLGFWRATFSISWMILICSMKHSSQ